MSDLLSRLQNLASALGARDTTEPGSPYVLGDDGLGCLRDLKRYLQHHDEKLNVWTVKSALASLNLVANDLCPILASWTLSQAEDEHKRRVCLACVELLVPMTWPMLLDSEADAEKYREHPGLKLAQSSYKKAILFNPEQDILSSIMRVAYPAMSKPRRERSERDHGIIKLVVYLIRNLVSIDEARNRNDTILALHKANALQFLCVLASGVGDEFLLEDVIIVDIIYNLVRGVDCSIIFDLRKAAPDTIKSDLLDLLSREKDMATVRQSKAHTRHNRFGTTVSVIQDQRRFTVASQTAIIRHAGANKFEGIEATKKWHKTPKQIRTYDDVDVPISLNTEARRLLGDFVSMFLDSGFNPLFTSVLKALEHDDDRISASAQRIQFLYLQGWCFRALRERGKAASKDSTLGADFDEDAEYQLVASMMEGRATIMLRKMLRESVDLKTWKETHAAMDCLRELLLTIDAMSLSSNVEFQEIAENLQSNLYYEESNLDLIVACVKSYNNQSFGYLNSATSLATILLKMLEKFASTKSHMFVRARRQRQNKKRAGVQTAPQNSDDETAEASAREAVKEKAFSFTRFEAKFMNDRAVDTFVALLEYYADLTSDQIKRVINFLHRVFVKQKIEVLIFRLDLFELLNRMVKDKLNLTTNNTARKEVENFTIYMFKRFQRTLVDSPALAWEILFEKLSTDPYYLTHTTNKAPVVKKPPRVPAELELKSGLSHEDQIKIVVAILLDQNQSEFLNWLKTEIGIILTRRQSWESEHLARLELDSGTSENKPTAEIIKPTDEGLAGLLFKDGKIRLLLKTLSFERLGDREDINAMWTVPSALDTDTIDTDLRLLKRYTLDPPTFEDNENPAKFLRRTILRRDPQTDDSSSTNDSSDEEITRSKPRSRKSRSRPLRESAPLDEEELETRRLKREALEDQRKSQIKSAKYILSSDEEETEASRAAFFAAEAALRERQRLRAMGVSAPVPRTGKARPKATATQESTLELSSQSEGSEAGSSNKENHHDSSKLFAPDYQSDEQSSIGSPIDLLASSRASLAKSRPVEEETGEVESGIIPSKRQFGGPINDLDSIFVRSDRSEDEDGTTKKAKREWKHSHSRVLFDSDDD